MHRENSTFVLGTLFNICNVIAYATVGSHLQLVNAKATEVAE
jgi:hypothetical protein